MHHSDPNRRLPGNEFVTGYTAVKALEHACYLAETTAWARRNLLLRA